MFEKIFDDAMPLLKKYSPLIAEALCSAEPPLACAFAIELLSNELGNLVTFSQINKAIVNDPTPEKTLGALEKKFIEMKP